MDLRFIDMINNVTGIILAGGKNRRMSEHIHQNHDVTVLMYHLVFPAKYRRVVFDEQVDQELRSVCLEIEQRY